MSGRDWRKAQRPSAGEMWRQTEEQIGWRTIAGGGCWCGQGVNHDWPDKEDGAPHPR